MENSPSSFVSCAAPVGGKGGQTLAFGNFQIPPSLLPSTRSCGASRWSPLAFPWNRTCSSSFKLNCPTASSRPSSPSPSISPSSSDAVVAGESKDLNAAWPWCPWWGDRGELDDSGDIVLLLESTFLLCRLGESESPGPGTEVNDVSTVGTDRCRPPTVDRGGVVLMGLGPPLTPVLLRAWILEIT